MPQKYEREIDDILRRMEVSLPRPPLHERLRRRSRQWLGFWRLPDLHVSPSRLMVAGLVFAMLSYLLQVILPALAVPCVLLSLLCFVAAIALSVVRGRRQPAPGWRGRSLSDRPDGRLFWESLFRRLRGWRRPDRRGPRY